MRKAISNKADEAEYEDRLNKITLINNIVGAGNAVRIDNFVGQATRDLARLESGMPNFDKIEQYVKAIRAVTVQQANLDQLDAIRRSANDYKSTMENVATSAQEVSETSEDLKRIAERFRVEREEGIAPV
jgi:methyl-accepting chemotaxis protein